MRDQSFIRAILQIFDRLHVAARPQRGEHRLPYLKNETQYRILIKQGGTAISDI